jgi:4-carboxymuconolactone decarboxylase
VPRSPLRPQKASPAALAAFLRAAALGTAPRAGQGLARALQGARAAGVPRRSLVELGLMLRLYAGFPAAIEFLRALSGLETARTIGPVRASQAGAHALVLHGEALCRRVYGTDYVRLRAFMHRLHPDLDRWMIEDGYGKTLARPGLSAKRRALATVAALAALGWTPQRAAHARGALRLGATAAEVRLAERIGTRCRSRARA